MALADYRSGVANRSARRFARDINGATVLVFALVLPILLAVMGGAIDYGFLFGQKSRLQNTADAAAVAAARELHLANTESSRLQYVVEAVVRAHLGADASAVKITTKATEEPLSVTVDLQQAVDGFMLSQFKGGSVGAHAVARISGGTPLCVLTLDETSSGNVKLEMNSRLTGNACAVYSNSRSTSGIISKDGSSLEAELICSSGGIEGALGNFAPQPLGDCPPMEDPLAGRPPPPVGPCMATDLAIGVDKSANKGKQVSGLIWETDKESKGKEEKDKSKTTRDDFETDYVTLSPGTYCGGITIGGAAHVTFEPGVYVMLDGPLFVTDFATIEGKHVGFYFRGGKSTLFLNACTTVDLIAPADGPMAGLLFFQDRNDKSDERFSILSDFARVLEGTMYLPNGDLYIDADQPVADKSAYTAIVARSLSLYAGPHVVLNTNYDQTDVPVPLGIAQDRKITLTE